MHNIFNFKESNLLKEEGIPTQLLEEPQEKQLKYITCQYCKGIFW